MSGSNDRKNAIPRRRRPPGQQTASKEPNQVDAPENACDPGSGDEAVGYGKPPRSGRFKNGTVPNPYGRRGKDRSGDDETLVGVILAELGQPITVTEGSKSKRMRKMRAFGKSLINRALKGDNPAARQVIGLLSNPALRSPLSTSAQPQETKLSMADEDIIDQFRQQCIEQYKLGRTRK